MNVGGIEVKTSSPDKVLYPDDGITKAEVIEFYAGIAELILPELRDRPLTVERYNKGIGTKGFYQKHAQKYFPEWLERATVKGKKTFIQPVVNKAADLVYMANQNALTMHVPTATLSAPDEPDRLIFDLDPPPGRFDIVVDAAREVAKLLAELELPSLLKTTGSKGLHVVVPLTASETYRGVSSFGSECAKVLCKRRPDIMTTEFYKKDRGGRLLVDVNRNYWQATAVAAYSLRAKNGAPVSLPLKWEELDDPELRPDGVGLRGLRQRLDEVGDLWAELPKLRVGLESARQLIAEAAEE